MNYFVMVKNREDQLHIRLSPTVKKDLRVVAELRGMTMSGLVYSLIVRTIREEREADPHAFRTRSLKAADVRLTNKIAGRIEPGTAAERRRIQRELDKPVELPPLG